MPRKVAVILVNWKSWPLTNRCIDSLLKSGPKPSLILVVDNESVLPPPRFSDTTVPVEVVRNKRNEGFAQACNQGIKRAMLDRPDFIWLLNNDTVIEPETLEALTHAMNHHPTAIACSPLIEFEDTSDDLWFAGGHVSPLTGRASHQKKKPLSTLPFRTQFLSGCSLFIRCAALPDVGNLRSEFFAYSEDEDWCNRAVEQGWDLLVVPTTTITHTVSGSGKKNIRGWGSEMRPPFIHYLMIRNGLWVIRLHSKSSFRRLLRLVIGVAVAGRFLGRNWTQLGSSRRHAIFRALIDGSFRQIAQTTRYRED